LKSRPRAFFGLCFMPTTSESMIAKLVFGNFDATVSIESAIRKPTPMIRS
jgi:hypothetical protein